MNKGRFNISKIPGKIMSAAGILFIMSLFCCDSGDEKTYSGATQPTIDHHYYKEIDTGYATGSKSDILYRDGKIYIGYVGGDSYDVKMAISNDEGNTWTCNTVDTNGIAHDVSLTADDTNIYMCYYESESKKIKLAKSPISTINWTITDIMTLGYTWPSNVIIGTQNNNLYVFYDQGNSIIFCKSENKGESWDNETIIQLISGNYLNMFNFTTDGSNTTLVFNENFYIDTESNSVLMFNRSTDDGETWDGSIGSYIIGGKDDPWDFGWYHSIYSNGNKIELVYSTADDCVMMIESYDGGENWGVPITVATDRYVANGLTINHAGATIVIRIDASIFKSSDGGVSWQEGAEASGGEITSMKIAGTAIYCSGHDVNSGSSHLLFAKSGDLGDTWIEW